jgi:hypothetical protein
MCIYSNTLLKSKLHQRAFGHKSIGIGVTATTAIVGKERGDELQGEDCRKGIRSVTGCINQYYYV